MLWRERDISLERDTRQPGSCVTCRVRPGAPVPQALAGSGPKALPHTSYPLSPPFPAGGGYLQCAHQRRDLSHRLLHRPHPRKLVRRHRRHRRCGVRGRRTLAPPRGGQCGGAVRRGRHRVARAVCGRVEAIREPLQTVGAVKDRYRPLGCRGREGPSGSGSGIGSDSITPVTPRMQREQRGGSGKSVEGARRECSPKTQSERTGG